MVVGFMLLYATLLTLSLPGAVLTLSLAAGALFGLALGALVVCISTVIGSSLAFLAARYLVRDWVAARLGEHMMRIDREVEQEGVQYLLTLRPIAVVPHFLINLGMGVTRMRLPIFAVATLVGVIPSTIIYVNAGTHLATVEQPSDVMSPGLVASLILVGILPLIAKFLLRRRSVSPEAQTALVDLPPRTS